MWINFDFSEYVPVRVEQMLNNNTYVAFSTSSDIYPNGKWLLTKLSDCCTFKSSEWGDEYVYMNIVRTNSKYFDECLNHNMVMTTKDRIFYDANLLLIEKYTKLPGIRLPTDIINYISEFIGPTLC